MKANEQHWLRSASWLCRNKMSWVAKRCAPYPQSDSVAFPKTLWVSRPTGNWLEPAFQRLKFPIFDRLYPAASGDLTDFHIAAIHQGFRDIDEGPFRLITSHPPTFPSITGVP